MISKETFFKAIRAIERNQEFEKRLNTLFREYCYDSGFHTFGLENALVSLLEEAFHDEDRWIQYAIYECNMLKNYKDGSCTDGNKNKIDISTWDKVYDFLISNNK